MANAFDWLTSVLGGGDPEATGAAQASTAMQPATSNVFDALKDRLGSVYSDTARAGSTIGNYLAAAPGKAIDYAGNEVARPFLQAQDRLYNTDWSQQPLIGTGPGGELTGRLPAFASMVTPYVAGGAPGGSLSSGLRLRRGAGGAEDVAAPNIIKGSDAPLFDTSRIDEVPNVPQVPVPRQGYVGGSVPAHVQQMAEKSNLDRLDTLAAQGTKLGGLGWYNTFPMRERWRGFLGEQGDPVFDRMMAYQSALSNNTKVPMQIRLASYFHALNEQGGVRGFNPYQEGGKGNWRISPEERSVMPPGYGAFVPSHEFNMRSIEGGQPPWYYQDIFANPKPTSYLQNFLGNYQPFTIDQHIVHAADLRGPPKLDKASGLWVPGKSPDTPGLAYPFMEEILGPRASKMGLAPAQYQASVWLPWNKVKSPIEPFVTTFENRIRATAERRGEKPELTLRKFVEASKGSDPLGVSLWSGGAPDLGGLWDIPDGPGSSSTR